MAGVPAGTELNGSARWLALVVIACQALGCASKPSTTPSPLPIASMDASVGARVAVVGDMVCPLLCHPSDDVATLVEGMQPNALLVPGDLLNNTANWNSYEEDWGALKPITYPVPGNHEYSAGINAYADYWGAAAHPPDFYFSFDLGSWHVVALNGELDVAAGSPEETWFRADLAAHPALCTAVLIHEPRWSSSTDHPSDPTKQALWADSVAAGVELWFAGHNHLYERFAALDADGNPAADGTTEFVIGTGGRQLYNFADAPLPGELVRDNHTFGAGLFTLGNGQWSMTFQPIPGQGFTDSASGTCHTA